MLSRCCKENIEVHGHWYHCEKCGKPTEPILKETSEKEA